MPSSTRSEPRFRLDRELGRGTTGKVWHGVLTEGFGVWPAGFEVAVKILHAELASEAAALAAFEAEAEAGAAVAAPGIVHVLHAGRDPRGRYLLMPYVPGRNLRDVLRASGPLPEPLLRGIARQVSGGLAALHAAGFVHGDVKPENVRLDAEGNAVLLDLGFSRRISPEGAAPGRDLRVVAPRPGSLPYLAPEQARGEAGAAASDLFALGVVLYELATGNHPFARHAGPARPESDETHPAPRWIDGAGSSGVVSRAALERPDADQMIAAIATARFVPPSRLVPQLSPFLDRVLERLLEREPARRLSAAELQQAFEEQEGGAWWRAEIEFGAGARRGGTGEHDAQHRMPIVGRDAELEALLGAFELAVRAPEASSRALAAGEKPGGGAVWIRGAAGSGKSRLVNEFASRARRSGDPPLYLYGRCRELEDERPCHPILRLLERYLRLPTGVAPRERERAELEQLVPPKVAETLLSTLDPEFEGTTPLAVPAALGAWLAALGARMPLLIFLDDVNWAGEDSLGVLARVAEELAGTRMLIVLGQRTDALVRRPQELASLEQRLAARARLVVIELAPLPEEAVEALVRELFHHSSPRLRLASVLWQRSRGNPGLLGELVRGMLARGDAAPHPDGSGLALSISPDDLPLPGSLHKAIAESYKSLPAADRTWLRRLAVAGGRIETEFLLRAFPDARRADVDAMLGRLVRSGWLAPSGARYRFTRPALREAVYRGLSRDQRVKLHAAAAAALEGERMTLEDAWQRAFHLRAAQDHAALHRVIRPLLARLLKAGQPQRVHSLALWGLEALDALPRTSEIDRQRIDLLEAAVDAADRLGFRKGQRELLDRLTDLEFDPDLDPQAVGRVYLLHGRYAVSTGQYGLARGCLRNAVQMFDRAGARGEYSEAVRRLSLVQSHVGELADARKLARRALASSQREAQRALAHLALGVIDVLDDRVEPALENVEKALHSLRADADFHMPGAWAAAYMLRARIYRVAGMPARAVASASRAVRLARIAGERRLEAEATARLGGALLDVDRPEEAELRLREALRLAEEIEDRRGQALARLFLGILLWESADREATPMLARTIELAVEMGLNRVEAVASAIQARVERERGDLERALRLAEHARALLGKYGAELGDRIVIVATLVLVLASLERAAKARELEEELRDRLYDESARIVSPLLRLRHQRAAVRLLDAALSPEGPVYPRIRVPEGAVPTERGVD